MKVESVVDRDFDERVLRSSIPVLVACRASYCLPSQQLVPIIEGHLASEAWPKPIAPMDDNRPTFEVPTRMITFSCKP